MGVISCVSIFGLGMMVGWFLCDWWFSKKRIVVISDTLKPANGYRSDGQRKRDAVLQLQNEIAESGALCIDDDINGETVVSLKLVK